MFIKIIPSYPILCDDIQFPIKAQIYVPAGVLTRFKKSVADQTQVRYLGHDVYENDEVIAHVACTDAAVERRIKAWWNNF